MGAGLGISAALALPVGAFCDAKGSQRVFLFGAVVGVAGLAACSQVTTAWEIVAAWALLLGPVMVCMFYEPAYVAVDQWFDGPKSRLIGVLTVFAWVSAMVLVTLTPSSAANSIAFLILYPPFGKASGAETYPLWGCRRCILRKEGFSRPKVRGGQGVMLLPSGGC